MIKLFATFDIPVLRPLLVAACLTLCASASFAGEAENVQPDWDRALEELLQAESEGLVFDEETALILEEIQNILETTIITASRTGATLATATQTIHLLPREMLEPSHNTNIPKQLDIVPSIISHSTGGPGSTVFLEVRGAPNRYTTIQYNGFPLKDNAHFHGSSSAFTEMLYGGLNVEFIEVLLGPSSTLYGSQAMSGTINIVPEKWMRGFQYESSLEVGQHNTFIKHDRASYGQEDYYLDVATMFLDTDGDAQGGDNDFEYANKAFFTSGGREVTDRVAMEFHSLYYNTRKVKSASGPQLDENFDPITIVAHPRDRRSEKQLFQIGAILNHDVLSHWDYSFKFGYTRFDDDSYDMSESEPDNIDRGRSNTAYLELQNTVEATDWLTLVLGGVYEKDSIDVDNVYYNGEERLPTLSYDRSWGFWEAFALARSSFLDDTLIVQAGTRYTTHEVYDARTAWEASAAYRLERSDSKFRVRAGTGFHMPTLEQAYLTRVSNGEYVDWGNRETLEAEESTSWEVGLDQFFFKKTLKFGLSYYEIDFTELVATVGSLQSVENWSEKRSRGIESFLSLQATSWVGFDLSYLYRENESRANNVKMVSKWADDVGQRYIPPNKLVFLTNLTPCDKWSANFKFSWHDSYTVLTKNANNKWAEWDEDAQLTVDAAVTYTPLDSLDLWLRVENLFDAEYTKAGYTQPGRWLYGGIKFTF